MAFYGLLLIALALVASAPFRLVFFSLTTATLVYKPSFSLLKELPGLSTPTVLTIAPLADGASSTIPAPLVSYTLSPFSPSLVALVYHNFQSHQYGNINTTTLILDRFGHPKTDSSSSFTPPQKIQPQPSQFVVFVHFLLDSPSTPSIHHNRRVYEL